jgi:hypothetical protein
MKTNEISKRLDKVEKSLTTQQAILVAMEKAMSRFGSLEEGDDWLGDHPEEHLLGDPQEALSVLHKNLGKEPTDDAIKAACRKQHRRVLLALLWRDCNRYAAELTDRQLPWLALVVAKLEALIDRLDSSACSDLDEPHMRPQDGAPWPAEGRIPLARREAVEAGTCHNDLVKLLKDLLEAHFTIATISERCFDGHAVLFRKYDHKLREEIELAEALANTYNLLIDHTCPLSDGEAGVGQGLPLGIDVDEIKRTAKVSGQAIGDRLIREAKSEIRGDLAGRNRAREILAPFLKELQR